MRADDPEANAAGLTQAHAALHRGCPTRTVPGRGSPHSSQGGGSAGGEPTATHSPPNAARPIGGPAQAAWVSVKVLGARSISHQSLLIALSFIPEERKHREVSPRGPLTGSGSVSAWQVSEGRHGVSTEPQHGACYRETLVGSGRLSLCPSRRQGWTLRGLTERLATNKTGRAGIQARSAGEGQDRAGRAGGAGDAGPRAGLAPHTLPLSVHQWTHIWDIFLFRFLLFLKRKKYRCVVPLPYAFTGCSSMYPHGGSSRNLAMSGQSSNHLPRARAGVCSVTVPGNRL